MHNGSQFSGVPGANVLNVQTARCGYSSPLIFSTTMGVAPVLLNPPSW